MLPTINNQLIARACRPEPPRMERSRVYCKMAFLEAIFEKLVFRKCAAPVDYIYWGNVLSFLSSSRLVLDLPKEIIIEKQTEDPLDNVIAYLRAHEQKSGQAFDQTEFGTVAGLLEAAIDGEKTEPLRAIYLTDEDSDECSRVSKAYGVMVFNIEDALNHKLTDLFSIDLQTISGMNAHSADSDTGWAFIGRYAHCCNSLVIVDPYLFAHDRSWEKNLENILRRILPTSQMELPFSLTLAANDCSRFDYNNRQRTPGKDLNLVREQVSAIIKRLRADLTVELSIFDLRGALHDRTLFTNYMYLNIGSGFDFLNDNMEFKPKRTTAVSFYPAAVRNTPGAQQEYLNLIYDIRRQMKRDNGRWYGDCRHRLLG